MASASVNPIRLVLIAILQSHVTLCTNQDVRCDPDVPSTPWPEVGQYDTAVGNCGAGYFLDGFECSPCEDGTFRTEQMARENKYHRCIHCIEPNYDLHEVVVEPCSRTKDATIMCDDGYFRSQVPGTPCRSECKHCGICGLGMMMYKTIEVSPCVGYKDTACCEDLDMVVVGGQCFAKKTARMSRVAAESTAATDIQASVTNSRLSKGIMAYRSCALSVAALGIVAILFRMCTIYKLV